MSYIEICFLAVIISLSTFYVKLIFGWVNT